MSATAAHTPMLPAFAAHPSTVSPAYSLGISRLLNWKEHNRAPQLGTSDSTRKLGLRREKKKNAGSYTDCHTCQDNPPHSFTHNQCGAVDFPSFCAAAEAMPTCSNDYNANPPTRAHGMRADNGDPTCGVSARPHLFTAFGPAI